MSGKAGTVVRIGLVQSACTTDRDHNITQALAGIAEAAHGGAEVVCLQELFAGQYPCQAEDHGKFAEAETVPGPLTERLASAAEELSAWLTGLRNDLESPAIGLNPAIGDVLETLRDEPESLLARVSGSGATCFALCAGDIEAEGLMERLERMRPDWWVKRCRLGGPGVAGAARAGGGHRRCARRQGGFAPYSG